MIKRRYSTGLVRLTGEVDEDVNPNSYLTNLADCMLVVAVGLLVALVTHYNVDLQKPEDQITGIEVSMDKDDDGEVDKEFEQTGTVYRDPETGKYYLVQD